MKHEGIYVKRKPHIYFNDHFRMWSCFVETNDVTIIGFGDSPEESFDALFKILEENKYVAFY